VPAPLAVSIALPFVQPSSGSRNSPPPLSTVTLPQLRMLFESINEPFNAPPNGCYANDGHHELGIALVKDSEPTTTNQVAL